MTSWLGTAIGCEEPWMRVTSRQQNIEIDFAMMRRTLNLGAPTQRTLNHNVRGIEMEGLALLGLLSLAIGVAGIIVLLKSRKKKDG